jgi:transposase
MPAEKISVAHALQRAALHGARGMPVADATARLAALAGDPAADAALDRGGVFEDMAADLRRILRLILERAEEPNAVILDGRTVQSTPESGARAGYDGHKRRSKVHIAVDTLGHLLALRVTSADQQERQQVQALAKEVQQATGQSVALAYVDQGSTGQHAADAAPAQGIQLEVVKLGEAKRGFVLLPRRWVVERSFAWMARFRRLARDYERLPQTFAGLHWLAFITLMLGSVFR